MITVPRFVYGDEVPADHPVELVKYPWCIKRGLTDWTEYQINWLTWWFEHNVSISDLARRCGRDYKTVYNKLSELGLITTTNTPWKPSYERLAETMTNREIADHTGCSITSVKRNLQSVRKRQSEELDKCVLELSYVMTNTDIAKSLGISRNNVSRRLNRAKREI